MSLEDLAQIVDIIVADGVSGTRSVRSDSVKEGPKVTSAIRIRAHAIGESLTSNNPGSTSNSPNDTEGPSMEIISRAEDQSLALWDSLAHVSPFARQLDGGFDSLCTGIHRQHHVVTKHLRDLLGEPAEDRVVECAR